MIERALMVAAVAAAANAGAAMLHPTNSAQMVEFATAGTNAYRLVKSRVAAMPAEDRAALDAAVAAKPELAYLEIGVAALLPEGGRAVAATIRGRWPKLAAEYEREASGAAEKASPDDAAERTREILMRGAELGWPVLTDKTLRAYMNSAQKAAKRNVRRKLREEGRAIVSRDGVDPAKERLDAVAAALNAPRFAGLADALAACGVEAVQPELPFVPAAGSAEMDKIMSDVFNGSATLKHWSCKLRYALGVEAYNAFVERYNGGK